MIARRPSPTGNASREMPPQHLTFAAARDAIKGAIVRGAAVVVAAEHPRIDPRIEAIVSCFAKSGPVRHQHQGASRRMYWDNGASLFIGTPLAMRGRSASLAVIITDGRISSPMEDVRYVLADRPDGELIHLSERPA